jgi:hypothetical protein
MNARTGLSAQQYEQLLKPLSVSRVSKRKQAGMELSYVEAWDVKAHLIRIFGFGGFSSDVIASALAFEDKGEKNWTVAYAVTLRLTVYGLGPNGQDVTYTEVAVGSSTGSRADAHDNAVKSAESDALKRAAINLGTQFGLSLYDSGRRTDVVGHTLCPPVGYDIPVDEPETGVEPSVLLPVEEVAAQIMMAASESELKVVWDDCVSAGIADEVVGGVTLRNAVVDRLKELREATHE